MRTFRTAIALAAFTLLGVAAAPPAWSGVQTSLVVSGTAVCISETEVQVTWTALNNDLEELDIEILGAIVISHGDAPVTLSPTIVSFGNSATGQIDLPEGPGTATLEVHYLFDFGAEVSSRQQFIVAQGTAELPDCRQETTTTTTTLATTTTVAETTTTAAPPAPPIPATPTYTG
jgi:hypothetical protein